MRFLSNKSIEKLRTAGSLPDLSGTGYALVEFLARGGMGAVYLAKDEKLNRRVALKILESEDPQGTLVNRLAREAQVLAQLEHPGIVPVHDAGTLEDGRVYYAMKFVQGSRLDGFLANAASLSERLRLFLRICDTISFAHSRGILHRDLKPANIMIGAFGEVLVMDWGLAKILVPKTRPTTSSTVTEMSDAITNGTPFRHADSEITDVTGDGMVMGTPGYMSPEQAGGNAANVDERSDVFSLGRLLALMVTESGNTKPAKSDRALRAMCEKASSRNPGDRYESVFSFAEDVSRFLEGLPVTAYHEHIWERMQRFYQRYQAAILLITAYLTMRALFILYSRH